MKIKAEIDGKELEFEVMDYSDAACSYVITPHGQIEPWVVGMGRGVRLRLIRPRHTFGVIVFEETGENRLVEAHEWYLADDGVCCWGHLGVQGSHKILRPVAIYGSE